MDKVKNNLFCLALCLVLVCFSIFQKAETQEPALQERDNERYAYGQDLYDFHRDSADDAEYVSGFAPSFNVKPDTTEELNVNFANKTEIEKKYIQAFYLKGKQDGDAMLLIINNLRNSLRDLSLIKTELHKTSSEGQMQPIPVKDFLDLVRKYKQESSLFLADVDNLEFLPALRPDIIINPNDKIAIQPLAHHYKSTLNRLESQISELNFTLVLPNGVLYQQIGIDISQLNGMSLYTSEQIADMKLKAIQLRAMRTQDKRAIDEGINRFTKMAIETFIDTFGTSERYRTSSDQQGKERAKELLIDAFWARSYIRATYGIPIGSIPVEYDKRIFNLDYYLSNMKVGAAPIYDQNKLMKYSNLAQEALLTIGNSTSKQWLSVNSWLTWISGKSNEFDTKYFVIALLKKDIDEEFAITQSGGLRTVRNGYRQYYLDTDVNRDIYQTKAKQIFASSSDDDDDDIEADVMMVEAGTLKGAIALCINALENQENRLDESRKLQNVIDMLTKDITVSKRRKKRQEF